MDGNHFEPLHHFFFSSISYEFVVQRRRQWEDFGDDGTGLFDGNLEIYADDVLCAHGATIGELDETQLFYLTSRGIRPENARAMLIEAFLDDAIDSIGNDILASMLRPVVQAWMGGECKS